MKNRFWMMLAFLAAFAFTSPAIAAPPEADAAAEEKKDDGTAAPTGEAKTEEKAVADTDGAAAATGDGDGDAKAEDEPKEIASDEEAVEAAQSLYTAIQEKHWSLALGLGLALLVFAMRKFKVLDKVPSKMLPWVAAVLGVVGYVAAALTTDGADMMEALMGGLMAGASAVGLWEMVLKNFLGAKEEAAAEG